PGLYQCWRQTNRRGRAARRSHRTRLLIKRMCESSYILRETGGGREIQEVTTPGVASLWTYRVAFPIGPGDEPAHDVREVILESQGHEVGQAPGFGLCGCSRGPLVHYS